MKKINSVFVSSNKNWYSVNEESKLIYNFDRTTSDFLNAANRLIVMNNQQLDLMRDFSNNYFFELITKLIIQFLDSAICSLTKWIDSMSSCEIKKELTKLRTEISHHIYHLSSGEN